MANIFEDNFNSYNNGDLNGQGSWDGNVAYDVQETIVKEGTKAVKFIGSGSSEYIKKYGTQLAAGTIGCYIRTSATNASWRINLWEDVVQADFIYFSGGNILSYKCGTLKTSYSVDTWYWVEWEWRTSPDKKVRARLDDGAWTNWFDPWNSWTTGPNGIRFISDENPSGVEVYFDYIAENPYSEETTSSSSSSQTTSSSSSSTSETTSSSSSSHTTSSSSVSSSSISVSTSSTILANSIYSRGSYASLPTGTVDLSTLFSTQDYTNVSLDDTIRVDITSGQYAIKQFKDKNTNNTDEIHVQWNGQSDLAPSISKVALEIYNHDSDTWVEIDLDNATGANTDFDLNGDITENISNYYDGGFWVCHRVYQQKV